MIKATYFLCIIALLVFFVDTLAYTLRLVIYKNKQYNLTSSTFNIISFVIKFAVTFQAPLLGILIDVSVGGNYDPIRDFRFIVGSATVGVFLAILLMPTFITIFEIAVSKVANEGSIVKGVLKEMKPSSFKTAKELVKKPKKSMLSELKEISKYKSILLFNLIVTSIYTIGMLAAYYASVQVPSHRLSIAGFSGSINSVASLVLLLILEPKIAMITDRAFKGEVEYSDLKLIVLILVISKLLGTVIAQFLFIPASEWILIVFRFLIS